MPELSRRDALRSVAATGALVLAGCAGEASHPASVPSVGEPVADPAVRFARDVDGEALFSVGDDPVESPSDRRPRPAAVEFLADGRDREEVTFHETDAGAALRAFVDATDFASEAVYLLEQPIGECWTLALVSVVRESEGGISADFCQQLRPADVACSAGTDDTVGVAIRLPFDGDRTSGLGTGMSSRCGPRPVVATEGGATT